MHPLQVAAYAFGTFNATVCIGLFFYATKGGSLTLFQRLALCFSGLSAMAYLSIRVMLLYEGIH